MVLKIPDGSENSLLLVFFFFFFNCQQLLILQYHIPCRISPMAMIFIPCYKGMGYDFLFATTDILTNLFMLGLCSDGHFL